MARKPNATREFRTQTSQRSRKSPNTKTSVAYRTARIARARQKREIEQQKREKLMFALFVVVILVMLLFAILIFKKVLGTDEPIGDVTDQNEVNNVVDGTGDGEDEKNNVAPATTVSVSKSAVNSGSLVLVNDSKPYISSTPKTLNMSESRTPFYSEAKQKNLYSYYVASIYNTTLEENALDAFNKMTDAFYEATGNIDLYVSKAYNESGVHATGLALDLTIWTGGESFYSLDDAKFADIYDWFFDNYHNYGFIISGESDHSFCFRYVGVPHAYYMHKHEIGLEEYLELVRKETLAYTDGNGDKYEVYYVHATGDVISVPLPSADAEYTISGDNSEGLIVTVKTN